MVFIKKPERPTFFNNAYRQMHPSYKLFHYYYYKLFQLLLGNSISFCILKIVSLFNLMSMSITLNLEPLVEQTEPQEDNPEYGLSLYSTQGQSGTRNLLVPFLKKNQ